MATPILVYSSSGRVLAKSAPPSVTAFTEVSTETASEVDVGNPSPILDYQPTYAGPIFSGGQLPRAGYMVYWPTIESLTGGDEATDLDAQPIYLLPDDALIVITIGNSDESHWLRVYNAASLVTDLDAGIIVPTGYDSTLRPYVLIEQPLGSGGGTESVVAQKGSTPLVNGQNYISIVFVTPQPDASWMLSGVRIVNTVAADALNIVLGTITAKTQYGFTILLSGAPDSDDYFMEWEISGVAPAYVVLPAPEIDPTSGEVPVDVTITAASGLQVIYTTDGTAPNLVNGTLESSPALIHLTAPCTLRAVSTNGIGISTETVADAYDPGAVVITPSSGEVPLNVVLTSASTADLIYTLDDTAPTLSNGTLAPSPVTLNLLAPCTVRAVATDGVDISAESSAEYVYTGREGDPTLIPLLVTWYRSDLVDVTDGLVSTWYDQSGNAIHATPDSTGLPLGGVGPTLVSSVLNGFPALRFNGTTSFLITGYQNFNAPNIFFIVAKQSSKATVGQFLSSFGDNYIRIGCDTSGFYFVRGDPTESHEAEFLLIDSTDHSGAFHNFESLWDLTSTTGWIDGTQIFTGSTDAFVPAVLPFGRDPNSETYLTGDIVEIIRYYTGPSFHNFTVSDRKWIEDYLSNRYNLPNRVPFAPGPMNIAGLAMWLKADALALADDAEITSWTDSSGNGFSPIKGTTGPAFKTNILNGHPVARFAASKWMTVSDVQAVQPCTVIFVSKGGGGFIVADHGPGGGFATSIAMLGSPYGFYVHANTELSDGVDHMADFHVFSIVLNGASTKGYIDGALILSGNAGASGLDKVTIGAYDQDGTYPSLVADIAELMIYRRGLTDHERNEIEDYLKVKYATP